MKKLLIFSILLTLLIGCTPHYDPVPMTTNTCNCMSDSSRLEYIKLATGQNEINTQSITITATKVKGNDFNNGSGIHNLDSYCPSTLVWYIFESDVFLVGDDYIRIPGSYHERLFFCTEQEAKEFCRLKNSS